MTVFNTFSLDDRLYGYNPDVQLYGMISSLFNLSFSVGSMVGPTVSGAVTQHYGFEWMTTIIAALLTLMVS